jgi:hypothetical protein
VPTEYGHREVLVCGYVHEVVIACAADEIARHPRSHEREDFIFNSLHYLTLLETSSRAGANCRTAFWFKSTQNKRWRTDSYGGIRPATDQRRYDAVGCFSGGLESRLRVRISFVRQPVPAILSHPSWYKNPRSSHCSTPVASFDLVRSSRNSFGPG